MYIVIALCLTKYTDIGLVKPVTPATSSKVLYSDSSSFILFISDLLCDVRHHFAGKLMPTISFSSLFGTLCPPILWVRLFFKTFFLSIGGIWRVSCCARDS